MISLRNALITDILPLSLGNTPEAKALGIAVNKAVKKFMEYSDAAMVYAGIDSLREEALDVLAVELGVEYYEKTFSVEKKREIIKNAFIELGTVGTKGSLVRAFDSLYESCTIKEWFDYSGSPFKFKVIVEDEDGYTAIERAIAIVQTYKNARSVCEDIHFQREYATPTRYIGAANIEDNTMAITSDDIVDPTDYSWYVDEDGVYLVDENNVLLFAE